MIRPLLALAAGMVALYLLVCVVMFAVQRSLIYSPQPRQPDSTAPTLLLRSGSERLVITTHRPARPNAVRPNAVLYFGGNAEDVTMSLPSLVRAFPEHALYLMHYRGFGGSSGRPTETALVADALALHEHVAGDHSSVVAVGRSLGSGIAIQLAVQRPLAGLVLVTPYDSLLELAAGLYPWLPVSWLLRDRYESWRFAPRVTVPTRFIIAGQDDVVPIPSSDRLQARFRPELVTRIQIPGTDHVTVLDGAAFAAAVGMPAGAATDPSRRAPPGP